jgi:hypothetical protein
VWIPSLSDLGTRTATRDICHWTMVPPRPRTGLLLGPQLPSLAAACLHTHTVA